MTVIMVLLSMQHYMMEMMAITMMLMMTKMIRRHLFAVFVQYILSMQTNLKLKNGLKKASTLSGQGRLEGEGGLSGR